MQNSILTEPKGFLNRNALKYFAVLCMLGDHIAYAFVPDGALKTVLEFFGGLTMPIMAFFLAEGCRYTKNIKKYALRLFVFALISAVPFCFLQTGSLMPIVISEGIKESGHLHFYISFIDKTVTVYRLNFLFTLLLSLINIKAWDMKKIPLPVKVLITLAVCILSTGCDWGYWCVLISFVFYKFKDKPVLKWILYSLIALSCVFYFKAFQNPLCFEITYKFSPVHFNLFIIIPLIGLCYNGQKGKSSGFGKWFFYVFYPAHLLIIDLLLMMLQKR